MAQADAKTVGAVAAAAAALAIGGWQASRYLAAPDEVRSAERRARESLTEREPPPPREEPAGNIADTPPERRVTLGGDAPSDARPGHLRDPLGDDIGREFSFARAASPTAAAIALVTASEDLAPALEAEPELAVLGSQAKLGLVECWRTLISPLVAQERDRFLSAVTRLGGLSGDDGAGDVFDRLSPLLAGASLDLSAAVARRVDPLASGAVPRMPRGLPGASSGAGPRDASSPPDVPMMMMVNRNTDADGSERRETTLDLPMQEVFKQAARRAAEGARTIEVWAPTRMTGRKEKTADLGLSVFMVWDQRSRSWQPIAMRLRLLSSASSERLRDAIRAARDNADTPENRP